jgi:hypothetical protein
VRTAQWALLAANAMAERTEAAKRRRQRRSRSASYSVLSDPRLSQVKRAIIILGQVTRAMNLIILFLRLVLRRVHFTYSNFAWGLNCGVDVKWSEGLLF